MFMSYFEYLEKASLDDKLEILKKKLFDISSKYNFVIYYGGEKNIGSIDNGMFKKVWKQLIDTDPTKNKQYLQWIIQKEIGGNPNYWKDKNYFGWREDSYQIEEFLTKFDELKRKNKIPVPYNDINKFKSIGELTNYIVILTDKLEKIDKTNLKEKEGKLIKSKQAEIYYESSKIRVIIPRTHEASCFFGRKTNWCTAISKSDFYDDYTVDGPLYIIQDKKNNDRYQFHFESYQFMDEDDNQIQWLKFYKNKSLLRELCKAFEKQSKQETFIPLILKPETNQFVYYVQADYGRKSFYIKLEECIYHPFKKPDLKTRYKLFEALLSWLGTSANLVMMSKDPRVINIIEAMFGRKIYLNAKEEISKLIIESGEYPDSVRFNIWKLYNKSSTSIPDKIKSLFKAKFKISYMNPHVESGR